MYSSENRAADAALALKNTGTGLGTENATIDHPEIWPEICTPYVFLSLFLSVTGLFTISKVQKSGGLAILTTSHSIFF